MAFYQIEFRSSAQKELEKLPRQVIPKIVAVIQELANDPFPHGVRKLSGFEHTYRVRVGDYRILYVVYETRLVIEIIRVGHRKDVYREDVPSHSGVIRNPYDTRRSDDPGT